MTSTPKSIEPFDGSAERERLAHAHEQIRRADEELTRLSEQVSKMQRASERPPSAGRERRSAPGRPALRALIGLPLAACVVVAAIAFQSSYGGGTKPVIASSPQLASTPSSPPENQSSPTQPALSIVQVAAAETAPPQATPVAENPPHETAPVTTAAIPDQTQLLQTMARDLANVERSIEQLKATQQQIASDNPKRHCGAQGEPGRDKTRAREGFRAEPVQGFTTSNTAKADPAQARADRSAAPRESAASAGSGSTTNGKSGMLDAPPARGMTLG